jgi:predicted MFS family arabinose efflux permease
LGLALNTAGANLGTVAVPALGGLLMATVGWRSTLALFGLVGAVVGALLIALLDEPRTQKRDGAGQTTVGPALWALLHQRDAVLLLGSHVIGVGGVSALLPCMYRSICPKPSTWIRCNWAGC